MLKWAVLILSKAGLKQIVLFRIHPALPLNEALFKSIAIYHVTVDEVKVACGEGWAGSDMQNPWVSIWFVRCLIWSVEAPVLMVSRTAPVYKGHIDCHWLIFICLLIAIRSYVMDFINEENFSFPLIYMLVQKCISIHSNSRNIFPVAPARKVLQSRHQTLGVDSQY